jgi:signal transduction histidine kinase
VGDLRGAHGRLAAKRAARPSPLHLMFEKQRPMMRFWQQRDTMTNPSATGLLALQDLYEARNGYLADGQVPSTVRPVVRESWKRSRQYGVSPGGATPQRLDATRLEAARSASARLLTAAEPVLVPLHEALAQQPHLIALSDADGVILRILCDATAAALAREAAGLFEGASWHERYFGCNGIGTALATGEPVILIGPEHFAADYIGWTCIGIPLHSPDGKLLGALDLSVPNEHVAIHTWGWVLSVARAIDRRLLRGGQLATEPADDTYADIYRPFHSVRGVIDLLALHLENASPTHRSFLDQALAQLDAAEKGMVDLLTELGEHDSARQRMVALVAHELASPITAIKNALVIKRVAGQDAEKVRFADEVIERQAHQLTRLVEDLLDMARLRTGKLSVQQERVDLTELLRQTIRGLMPFMEKRGHRLVQNLAEGPVWATIDPARIRQVASNLLVNAARYTGPGGTIEVRAWRERDAVFFRVADDGTGIDPSRLQSIFNMFEQTDHPGAKDGLGIGLAVVKALVEAHGGRVEAASHGKGTGTAFTVQLPSA